MAITKIRSSDAEQVRYLDMALTTETALSDAILLLENRKTITANPNETRQITVELADLRAKVAKVRAEMIAFQSGNARINPPSADDVEAVKSLARQLDEMTANSVLASTVLTVTTDLIKRFNATNAADPATAKLKDK